MKKVIATLLTGALFASSVCTVPTFAAESDKTMTIATNFSYDTIDPHDGNSSWYNGVYGLTENLFKIADDFSIQPCLAEKGEMDGNIWTITLKDNLVFSNGNPVTPEMVIRNLQRAAEVNPKASFMENFTYETVDQKTFKIICDAEYPTLLNTLSTPGYAIADLDATTEFTSELVATGPFVIEKFEPGNLVSVSKNEQYWDGEVQMDQVDFYYMQDDDAKLMAMQNGELDAYTGVTAAAKEMYEAEPDTYDVVTRPATRLQFYLLNKNNLSDNIRKAINLTVDAKAMEAYLGGTVSATSGPFNSSSSYGKAEAPEVDTEQAKTLIEEDGYTLNKDGFYEKDGNVLTLNISYYAARSLDVIATLMQEQLKNIGIQSELVCEEDPDATYMKTGNFDIALYCCIADMTGDPQYFIDGLVNGAYTIGGFDNEECKTLYEELSQEADPTKRAELANQIIQLIIDDNSFGFISLFNKITVLKKGVSNYAENSPFDFYGISKDTIKK